MSMKLGSNAVSGLYLGSGAVYKAYRGSNAVFDHAYFHALLSRIASESPYAIPQADIISAYNALTPTVKDDAAYILMPCAYKTGKIYGMARSGTADFDFARSSGGMRVNASGLLELVASGTPRFQYHPVTKKYEGLLMEKASTNLLTYSEDLINAAWSKNDCTITSNSITAPDGNLTADLITDVASTSTADLRQTNTATFTAGTTVTYSMFAKRGNHDWVRVRVLSADASSHGANAWFNLATGAKGTVALIGSGSNFTSDIKDYGNGWYRLTVSGIVSPTDIQSSIVIVSAIADNSTSRVQGGATKYIWGAQLEQSAVPTSYIPTLGASATRAADSLTDPQGNVLTYPTGTIIKAIYKIGAGALQTITA